MSEEYNLEENELAAHIMRNWPKETDRPEVDPEAKKELDELWKALHGSEQMKESISEKGENSKGVT